MQEGQEHWVKCTYMSIYYGQTLWCHALRGVLESKKAQQQHIHLQAQCQGLRPCYDPGNIYSSGKQAGTNTEIVFRHLNKAV